MKAQNIREKTVDELKRELHEKQEELFRYRFQATLGKLENAIVIRNARRTIARLKTIINEKNRMNQ
ncbi:50S ribosomal protein L29 [bacterium]|nr:50S ribosomal protein L29 [candidate division CSSED10-310 bacterium]